MLLSPPPSSGMSLCSCIAARSFQGSPALVLARSFAGTGEPDPSVRGIAGDLHSSSTLGLRHCHNIDPPKVALAHPLKVLDGA
eukprot:1254614-Pyramimonas_sp.AAC.1